jgi:thioredoxin-dependent peroxiredoxin
MKAPDFTLSDQNGKTHSLKDYSGKWLVLYFYPKDETSGCTTEACSFRDAREVIAELGQTEIVGVSKDSVASHKKFADNHKLPFTLLSDPEHTVIEAYGAWAPRKFMGREYLGTHRNTVIIDPAGEIVKKYEGVDPAKHVAQIIQDLKKLQGRD